MSKAEQLKQEPVQEKIPTPASSMESIDRPDVDQESEEAIESGEAALESAKSEYGEETVQELMTEQGTEKNLETVWGKIKESAGKIKKSLLLAGVGLAGLGAVGATSPDLANANTINPDTKQELKQNKFIEINAAKKLGFAEKEDAKKVQKTIQNYLVEKTGKISLELPVEETAKQLKLLKSKMLEMGVEENSFGLQFVNDAIKDPRTIVEAVKVEKKMEVKATKLESKVEVASTPEADELFAKLLNMPDNPRAVSPAQNRGLQGRAAQVMIQKFALMQKTGKTEGNLSTKEMKNYLSVLEAATIKAGVDLAKVNSNDNKTSPGIIVLKNMIRNN